MLRTTAIALASLLAALPALANASPEHTHVRAVHPDLAAVLDSGIERSATLRAMIDALQRTDVVVLLACDGGLSAGLDGGLSFITRAGPLRLLRVSIRRSLSHDQMIVIIGHELQHALEVASAPQVVDEMSLRAFYRQLDRGGGNVNRYDTADAQRAGDNVGADLRGYRRSAALLSRRDVPELPPGKGR